MIKLLICILSVCIYKTFGITTKKVTGSEVVYVQNGDQARFQWQFNFPITDVFLLKVNHIKLDNTVNGKSILDYRQGTLIKSDNSQFLNRITGTISTDQRGILLDVSSTTIADQGSYRITVETKDFYSLENSTKLIVKVPPAIDKQLPSLEKTERDYASIQCVTTAGNPKPMFFQWFKSVDGKWKALTSVTEAYDRYAYNISYVNRDSRGEYKCEVSNIGGKDSHIIDLKVRYTPVVISPPLNRSVFENSGTEEFNCGADGNPAVTRYRWYIGTKINEITQNTNVLRIENNGQRLKFTKPSRSDATFYFCAGENALGTGQAKGAFLNVTYVPGTIIIPGELNGVVNGDERTNLTVKCTSDANPPAQYTWSKKSINWRGEQTYVPLVLNSYSGNLHLYNVSTNDTGSYKCVAENSPNENQQNQKYSKTKDLDIIIRYGPYATNLTVNGTVYESFSIPTIEVRKGDQIEIRCLTLSEPPANYEIQLRTSSPTQLNTDSKIGYYKIQQMDINDEGIYQCIASNPILNKEEKREIKLIVAIPPTMIQPIPNNRDVAEDAVVKIICNAEGKPAPKVYWQKYGMNITTNGTVIKGTYGEVYKDIQLTRITATLEFNGIRYTDTGGYSCIIYNSAGHINTTASLTVLYAPKITKRPENVTVRAGDNQGVSLVCEAVGNPKEITWTWLFNGEVTSIISNRFNRGIPDKKDNGIYTCQSRNSHGDGESASAYVRVEYKPDITFITSPQTVDVGKTVQLRCEANGVPEPKIVWTNNLDNKFEFKGKILVLNKVIAQSKGLYSCSATNVVGGDTKSVKVSVRHAPIITTTTPAQTKVGVSVGNQASLTCGVSSFPLADIKWTEKGSTTPLQDGFRGYTIVETSSDFGSQSHLSVTVTESLLGKQYVCTAKNSYGDDDQEFQVLARGRPETPVSMTITDVLVPTVPVTANITIEWVPGYDGGYAVQYYLLYREVGEVSYRERYIGSPEGNKYVFEDRKAGTTYEFSMKAKNERGVSSIMPSQQFSTKPPPPDVAKISIKIEGTEGTAVTISWIITKQPGQTRRRRRAVTNQWDFGIVKYRIVDIEKTWTEEMIRKIALNGSYTINNLDGDELYEFQFVLYDKNGGFANPIAVGKLYPRRNPVVEERSGLSKTDIIALVVGCGGAILLIVIIILFIVIHRKKDNKTKKYKSHYNNGRVQVDIPVSATMKSGDYVRSSYLNDEDPFAMDSSILDDGDKSPPPDYNSVHYSVPPADDGDEDHADSANPHTTFKPEQQAPSYTSFGRLPKKQQTGGDRAQSKSMTSLNAQRATEISRRNENRYSIDALDSYPERREVDPLLRNTRAPNGNTRDGRNQRHSRGRLSSDEDLPEPPTFMRDALRSPPSDDGGINNRVPGAFGDKGGRFKKPSPRSYDAPSQPAPPPTSQSGRHSPAPSSVASSKPYRSDNEYIDDADDNYVGYLV